MRVNANDYTKIACTWRLETEVMVFAMCVNSFCVMWTQLSYLCDVWRTFAVIENKLPWVTNLIICVYIIIFNILYQSARDIEHTKYQNCSRRHLASWCFRVHRELGLQLTIVFVALNLLNISSPNTLIANFLFYFHHPFNLKYESNKGDFHRCYPTRQRQHTAGESRKRHVLSQCKYHQTTVSQWCFYSELLSAVTTTKHESAGCSPL